MNPQYIIGKFLVELIVSVAAGLLADKVIEKVKDVEYQTMFEGFELGRRYYEYENSK